MTPRIYYESTWRIGDEAVLRNEQHHYLTRVLRIAVGQTVVLFGNGKQCECRVTAIDRRACRLLCERELPTVMPVAEFELWLAVIKSARMDYAVQKAGELGVTHIRPLMTQRSINRSAGNPRKLAHWHEVAVHASQQCGRCDVPEIHEMTALRDLYDLEMTDDWLNLALLPDAEQRLMDVAGDTKVNRARLLIGPEGGFDDDELRWIESAFTPVSLGPRILRAETAVVAGLTLLGATMGDL